MTTCKGMHVKSNVSVIWNITVTRSCFRTINSFIAQCASSDIKIRAQTNDCDWPIQRTICYTVALDKLETQLTTEPISWRKLCQNKHFQFMGYRQGDVKNRHFNYRVFRNVFTHDFVKKLKNNNNKFMYFSFVMNLLF